MNISIYEYEYIYVYMYTLLHNASKLIYTYEYKYIHTYIMYYIYMYIHTTRRGDGIALASWTATDRTQGLTLAARAARYTTPAMKATDSVALTQVDAGFQDKRDLLTEHLRLVSGAGQCGARKFRWLKTATDCRPGFA
jgi:hypothetical protein